MSRFLPTPALRLLAAATLLSAVFAVSAYGDGVTSIFTSVENRSDTSGNYTDPNNGSINYQFNSGSQNSIFLEGFTTSSGTYELLDAGLDVKVRRSNPNDTFTSLTYVHNGESGGTYNIISNRATTYEQVLGGNDLSDGAENLFMNSPGDLGKTVERVDYVYEGGYRANNNSQLDVGFLFFERDANNQFAVAPITEIDVNGDPTAFGDLVEFGNGTSQDFGNTLSDYDAYTGDFNSVSVFGDPAIDPDYQFKFSNSQEIGGVYLSFGDLGIEVGETIYGYALFANDNSTGTIPVDVTDSWYNKNTTSQLLGGGDLYLGGVLFNNDGIDFSDIVISTDLYWDRNGSTAGAGTPGSNSSHSGTWTNSSGDDNWGNVDGTDATQGWIDNKVAVFSAGTTGLNRRYNIEVDDVIETKGLRFEEGRVRLRDNNGTGDKINMNGIGYEIEVLSTARGEIYADLDGTVGFTKTGAGRLDLRGNNTYTGTANIQQGEVRVFGGSALSDTDRVHIGESGTLRLQNDETVGSISGSGLINLTNDELTFGGDNTSSTFSGRFVSNSTASKIIKNGTGTTTLTGNNDVEGDVIINSGTLELAGTGGNEGLDNVRDIYINGGTLLLSTANQVDNAADLIMNTGTLALSDNNETMRSLTLTDDSTIDTGTGDGAILNFTGNGDWDNNVLTIVDWDGIIDVGGGNDQIIFGNTLSQDTLDNVYWAHLDRFGAIQLGTGEIVPFTTPVQPIPEPSTYAAGGFLVLLIGLDLYRRRKKKQAAQEADAA